MQRIVEREDRENVDFSAPEAPRRHSIGRQTSFSQPADGDTHMQTVPLRVLLIEDCEDDAHLIRQTLKSHGFDPALSRIETESELKRALGSQPWDVVICDYSLPRYSGMEALRVVKGYNKDLPFILVSGTIHEERGVHAIRTGADDYLLKDRLLRLGHAVERVIELRRSRERRAEELRESERRFRHMLENVDLIAITLDATGQITLCNDYLLRLTGWDRSEIVGANWFDKFIPPGNPVKELFYESIERGVIPTRLENPILTRDGRLREVEWNNTALRCPEGKVIGVACMGADVTDRNRDEEAKAALALRSESFVQALGEIVYDHDVTNDRIDWGGHPERYTGWSVSDLGLTAAEWRQRIHPEDLGRVDAEFEAALDKPFFTSEYRFRRKDGGYAWIFDRGSITRNPQGQVTRVIGVMIDVTHRHTAEEQLRSRTAFSEALLQSAHDGIIVVDSAGKTILQNQRAIELWKMPEEIATTVDDQKRVQFVMNRTKDPRGFVEKVMHLYANPLETSRDEIELVNGTILDRTSAPVTDGAGTYYGRVWNFHDITDQKRAEQRIADELNFNHTIFEAAPFGIITYQASGDIISANEAAARLIGARHEQLSGTNFRLIDSWKVAGLLPAAERALKTGEEQQLETQFVSTYGKTVWLALRFVPFHYAGEQHLLVIFNDIEERKRSEAALRESQQRFQQLAEHIAEVFWMTNARSHEILYVSPAYEKMWGRPIQELLANPRAWYEPIHPDDRERVRLAVQTLDEDGKYDESYRVVRPDGSICWIHDRAFPIRDESGQVYRIVGLAEDITNRRQLEEQYRQSQKMEAIGTLAGGIAHDFNNILGAIIGYTELAKVELQDRPEVRAQLDAVTQASDRAAALVRQILAFSRKQAQERKVIQLRHIVSEAVKLLRATIPSTIEFSLNLRPDVAPVMADATQIHQVIINLATNAWHAMKERPGTLGMTLQNITVDASLAARHSELRPGSYVRLSISDTGHGMNQATLQRIFEPFFTTKGPGEGTGLGLAVVHGIVQTHEAVITVESEIGQGTTFHLYFPAHQEVLTTGEVVRRAVPSGGGERILLVDDEPSLVRLGTMALKRLGYTVDAYSHVGEALAKFVEAPAAYDLVLTDFTMPAMNGVDFAQAILKLRPDVPVIMMTGYTADLTLERAQKMGIREVLLKPLTLEILGTSVQRALGKQASG